MSIELQRDLQIKIKAEVGIGKKFLFMSEHPDYQKMFDMQVSAIEDLENRTNDILKKLGRNPR